MKVSKKVLERVLERVLETLIIKTCKNTSKVSLLYVRDLVIYCKTKTQRWGISGDAGDGSQ